MSLQLCYWFSGVPAAAEGQWLTAGKSCFAGDVTVNLWNSSDPALSLLPRTFKQSELNMG